MEKTFKTLGISLVLLTASISANTAFADSSDKMDLDCSVTYEDKKTYISWEKPGKDLVSSYKFYISDPLSQSESFKTDIPVKYFEDSSKLGSNSSILAVPDLEAGKYYRFKLEAYKDNELVKSKSFGSIILADNDEQCFDEGYPFTTTFTDQHTLQIDWTSDYDDKVKRTMKFYSIGEDGFHDFGTVDFDEETYTFKNLQSDKRYYVAGEVYEGDTMIFTYQFGFTTGKTKAEGNIKDSKNYEFNIYAVSASEKQIDIKTSWSGSDDGYPPLKNIEYKTYVSQALSSDDFYANKKLSCKCYSFDDDYSPSWYYYVPYSNGSSVFDQWVIYKKAVAGKYDKSMTDKDLYSNETTYSISDLKANKYYRIKTDAYWNGKLIASDTAWARTDNTEHYDLFSGDFHNTEANTKDGKSVEISWKDQVDDDMPKGKRTVYLYISSACKDENKVYDYDKDLSAKFIGKTDYSNTKYLLKGLKPGRHYRLYMEVRYKDVVEDNTCIRFSTTVRTPELDLTQVRTDSVKIRADESDEYYWKSGSLESSAYYINCIEPDGFEYYKKGKDGKFKKIASASFHKPIADKNVSLGGSYTYKARAYVTINGKKYYSGLSKKFTIRITNTKPVFKIEFVDKKEKIVKITSDKNNEEIMLENSNLIGNLLHGNDRSNLKKGAIKIKPGKTVYFKPAKKNTKKITMYSIYNSNGTNYNLTLDFGKYTYKLTK